MTARIGHFRFPTSWGAIQFADGTTRFRLWAPAAAQILLEVEGLPSLPMRAEPDGWHEAQVSVAAGAHYRFRLPSGLAVPDPASRFQPEDVHGPSMVVDPLAFAWNHPDWPGRPWHEAVIYELHPGLAGGFAGITEKLPALRDLGITAVELMPVADFPGPRNWGYDGVLPYAPDHAYGTPDDLKRLVDTAHGLGLMVLLDVVYNHLGPDGNYLHLYAPEFFTAEAPTPWGPAIDFRLGPVQDFFAENALYWLTEYRLDGLRFDAVDWIAPQSFLDELARRIRAGVGPGRAVHLVLEHGGNRASLLDGLYDAQWSDDLHHCLHVLLTGETDGYYRDYQNAAVLLARCLSEGFAYQGEISPRRGRPQGEQSAHLAPTAFVGYLQNHDQIGNRAGGERLTRLASPEALRAATALLLLAPSIPLLFAGQENGATTPFYFFTSFAAELAAKVRAGRLREFAAFARFATASAQASIPDPNAPETYAASRTRDDEPGAAEWRKLHGELLALRAEHVTPRLPGLQSSGARPLGGAGVLACWRAAGGARLALAANLGAASVDVALPTGIASSGVTLFETARGAAQSVLNGILPAHTTVAFLEESRA